MGSYLLPACRSALDTLFIRVSMRPFTVETGASGSSLHIAPPIPHNQTKKHQKKKKKKDTKSDSRGDQTGKENMLPTQTENSAAVGVEDHGEVRESNI